MRIKLKFSFYSLKQHAFYTAEVLHVKSVKLDTNKANKDGKVAAKSEDNIRKSRRNILKNQHEGANEGTTEVSKFAFSKFV